MTKKKVLTIPRIELGKSVDVRLEVTPAPKETLLQKALPSHSRAVSGLYAVIATAIDRIFDKEKILLEAQGVHVASMGIAAEHAFDRKRMTVLASIEKRRKKALDALGGYSLPTLRLLAEAVERDNTDTTVTFLIDNVEFSSESEMREVLSYRNISRMGTDVIVNILNSIRLFEDRFALEDLSSLTGEDRHDAEALFKVIEGVLTEDMNNFLSSVPSQYAHNMQKSADDTLCQMSYESRLTKTVADIAITHPDRILEIAAYVLEWGWELTDAESERLILMLDNDSHSLSEGVL